MTTDPREKIAMVVSTLAERIEIEELRERAEKAEAERTALKEKIERWWPELERLSKDNRRLEDAVHSIPRVANEALDLAFANLTAERDAALARASELEEALKDTTVHLIGAASAYDRFARGDALKSTRVSDMEKCIERARPLVFPTPPAREGSNAE